MQDLFSDLGTEHKVFIEVACSSHFLGQELQRRVTQEASKERLLYGSVQGIRNGVLSADAEGHISR